MNRSLIVIARAGGSSCRPATTPPFVLNRDEFRNRSVSAFAVRVASSRLRHRLASIDAEHRAPVIGARARIRHGRLEVNEPAAAACRNAAGDFLPATNRCSRSEASLSLAEFRPTDSESPAKRFRTDRGRLSSTAAHKAAAASLAFMAGW